MPILEPVLQLVRRKEKKKKSFQIQLHGAKLTKQSSVCERDLHNGSSVCTETQRDAIASIKIMQHLIILISHISSIAFTVYSIQSLLNIM